MRNASKEEILAFEESLGGMLTGRTVSDYLDDDSKKHQPILNQLEYNGYYTRIHFSAVDKVLYGKIENIRDLVSFESDSAKKIEKEFHKAVNEYSEFIAENYNKR